MENGSLAMKFYGHYNLGNFWLLPINKLSPRFILLRARIDEGVLLYYFMRRPLRRRLYVFHYHLSPMADLGDNG